MKVENLRVGNYLEEYSGDLLTWGISEFTLIGNGIDVDEVGTAIPLTEYYLVKFGFVAKKDRNNTKWTIPNRLHGNIMYYPLTDQFIYLYHGIAVHLESIHQLQNLVFALTGEELTISAEL